MQKIERVVVTYKSFDDQVFYDEESCLSYERKRREEIEREKRLDVERKERKVMIEKMSADVVISMCDHYGDEYDARLVKFNNKEEYEKFKDWVEDTYVGVECFSEYPKSYPYYGLYLSNPNAWYEFYDLDMIKKETEELYKVIENFVAERSEK